jgi:hypothetical protein
MLKKNIYIIILVLLVTSCADTFDSVKRGLTGAKGDTADEFLVKKKDPLILPPDFENLPTPNEKINIKDEVSDFEKNLEISDETNSSTLSPVENSILKKIRTR